MTTGLEKIIKSIEEDSQKSAEERIQYAKNMANSILDETRKEITRESLRISDKAEKDADNIISRAKSLSENEMKKMILNAKSQIISEIINQAKEKILSLKDEDYFDFILKIIESHLENQDGEFIFSEKDLNRLSENFKDKIKSLEKNYSIKLTISNKTRNITGGVIISYGDIEENCSIENLFENNKDEIFDSLSSFLFSLKL